MVDGQGGCFLPQILPKSCEQLDQPQHWYFSCSIGMQCLFELPNIKISSPMGDKGKEREFSPPRKVRKLADTQSQCGSRQCSFSAQSSSSECTDCSGQGGSNEGSNDNIIPGLDENNIAMNCLARSSRSDYGALALVNWRFNSLVRNGELYVMRRQLGIVEHWIYCLCNLVAWEAFDPKQGRWMRLPQIPSDECFTLSDKESLAVGTELLVFGREVLGSAIWRYSILTHRWFRAPPMNQPRCLFGSGSSKERAIVAGGCDTLGVVLKSAELYNSELGTWEMLPDMHSPRKLCSGFFMDGKFYVIGGMINNTESLTCGEEFSLETRTWRRIPDMYPGGNGAAHAPPLVAVVNDQLYAVEYSQNEIKKYNKETNSWNVLGGLPVRADSRKQFAISEAARSNPCRCNSMKAESKAVVCMSRSEVRNTGGMMSEEEAKIKAELAEEIEKALQMEIEQQISALSRRLQELRHQTKSEIHVKKSSPTKGVLPRSNNGGAERRKKFRWESSLRSSSGESGSFRRRPWNDNLSSPSPSRCPTTGRGKENCRGAESVKNSLLEAVVSGSQSLCAAKPSKEN